MEAEFFHAQTDGQTDMTKIIVVIRTSANASKNVPIFYGSCSGL